MAKESCRWIAAIALGFFCVPALAAESGKSAKAPDAAKADAKPAKKVGQAAERQQDPQREKLDEALRLAKREQYAEAATALYDLLDSAKGLRDEIQYNLAKSLYRLGLYHSALEYFTELLARGAQSHYYEPSLEWSLFISRKIVGDQRVYEPLARYAPASFPKEYSDEFNFQLAKFHYQRALAIEAGAVEGAVGGTQVRETVTGGKSFKGDIFSGEGGEGSEPPADDKAVKKKDGGGISIGEDIFGTGGQEEAPKGGATGGGKEKGGKGKGGKGKGKEAKKEEPPPPEPPKKEEPKKKPETGEMNAKEHIEAAAQMVKRVNPESRFGPRAKFLEGVIDYKLGRDNDALDAFKAVVRLTKAGQPNADAQLRELAFFQLARTHFGAKQPSYSIFYYDKIDRDSYAWLDAIYESSWAEFRLGNFEKALGNLLTLHSPFFKDEYYPESHILKAVIYYENCRYPEAKAILSDFLKHYEPVEAELSKMTERDLPPAKYYEIMANLRGKDTEQNQERANTLGQILRIALRDRELRRLDASFREVDEELKGFGGKGGGFGQSRLASHLQESLGKVREGLGRDAGHAVKRTLERERDAIKVLIQQSVRIDVETSRAEQERMEGTLQGIQSAPPDREREFTEWTNDERIVWPFTGEYWRDELGTYQLTLAHSCQARSNPQQ